jgi:hypothetical protein
MNRRDFLTTSIAIPSLITTQSLAQDRRIMEKKDKIAPEYYELRLYHLRRGPKTKIVDDFFSGVAIPAMNRAGIGTVGCFNVMLGPDSPTLYVLIPHGSLESFLTLRSKMEADVEYQKASSSFFGISPESPAYIRMESSLMVAFDAFPKLEVPEAIKEKRPRIFELRIYESHNERSAKKKIEMFNTGEIDIFKRTGLKPVFFGETLIGTKMPNLTYMLTFDDIQARDKSWSTFGSDPEWKKLSTTPGFTDAEIITNISSLLLRPTAYSQI